MPDTQRYEVNVATGDANLDALIARLHCPVIRPGQQGYDEARKLQNGLIDRHPALIVRCTGTADVVTCVNFARDNGIPLSVRGGGHNVAGTAMNDGGIVIDLSQMRGVYVDPRARTARVQGGATWADVDRETQLFGLATPGGLVSTTGVAGFTLHGGYGHLRRKFGLSLDNLLSVEIVTADGVVRTASETEHPDLFWAVRGAGSNFGVVTSLEYRLHPVGPTVMLAACLYSLDDAPAVLRKWRSYAATAPEEVSPLALFWSVPPGFPPELVGKPVVIAVGVYAGPVEDGERVLRPMREFADPVLDLSEPTPYVAVQNGFDAFFPKGMLYYWKSTYVEDLSDSLLDTLCDFASTRPSPSTTMDIWPLTGAPTRVPADATAFGRRAPFLIAFEFSWTDPTTSNANITWAREAYEAMRQFSSSGIYLNFPGFGEDREITRNAYGSNYDRLVALKTRYDPGNLFRSNINIRPVAHEARPEPA